MKRCESNGCVEVTVYRGSDPATLTVRWHSGDTGTVMQTPLEEAKQLIRRIKSGELDFLLEE